MCYMNGMEKKMERPFIVYVVHIPKVLKIFYDCCILNTSIIFVPKSLELGMTKL